MSPTLSRILGLLGTASTGLKTPVQSFLNWTSPIRERSHLAVCSTSNVLPPCIPTPLLDWTDLISAMALYDHFTLTQQALCDLKVQGSKLKHKHKNNDDVLCKKFFCPKTFNYSTVIRAETEQRQSRDRAVALVHKPNIIRLNDTTVKAF